MYIIIIIISVPLNFWHHAPQLPLVRRVGAARSAGQYTDHCVAGYRPMVGLESVKFAIVEPPPFIEKAVRGKTHGSNPA